MGYVKTKKYLTGILLGVVVLKASFASRVCDAELSLQLLHVVGSSLRKTDVVHVVLAREAEGVRCETRPRTGRAGARQSVRRGHLSSAAPRTLVARAAARLRIRLGPNGVASRVQPARTSGALDY